MAIDTSLFVNIVSTLKDKGFKDSQKSMKKLGVQTKLLDNSLVKLAKRAVAFESLRRSFMSFVQDDAAAKRLSNTLDNLGLAFSALKVNDYIDSLEKTAAVSDDQLRPAFETLARVTGNFAQTQDLLNTALNVAAGTGNDVVTVSRALARAYAGNTAGLSRLNAGLTKAQISSGNFALIITQLNETFAGQAQNQVETYKGKVELLKIAFDNAGEALGKGIVDGLTALNGSDVQTGVNAIVKAGEIIGGAFRFAGKQIGIVRELFSDLSFFQSAERELELYEKFRKADDPARTRAASRERRVAFATEQKAAAALAKLRAKEAAATKAKLDNEKKLKAAGEALKKSSNLMDLEKIQLEAASQGKLTESEKLRVEYMQKRLDLEDAIAAKEAGRASALATQLTTLEEKITSFKPVSPFGEWEDAIFRMSNGLNSLGLGNKLSGQTQQTPNLTNAPTLPQSFWQDPSTIAAAQFQQGMEREMAARSLQIFVQGTGGLDDQTKRAVVDAVVEASGYGIATNWFRTTGTAIPIA